MKMPILVLILGLFLSSCSVDGIKDTDRSPLATETPAKEEGNMSDSQDNKVWVYKYDGSLQCEMGHATSLESMEIELKNMRIYHKEKRSDGLMRIQKCGSPTGRANVYQINKQDIKKATNKGFQIWTFD